jgi:hypothetical protein
VTAICSGESHDSDLGQVAFLAIGTSAGGLAILDVVPATTAEPPVNRAKTA